MVSGFNNGGDIMFTLVPIFMGIVFVLVIGVIIFSLIRGVSQWRKNEASPRLSVPAAVKSKRTHITRNGDHGRTVYYVTFEFESGDRSELKVTGQEFGLLAEGDYGILSFQGTRYLGFQRENTQNA